MKPRRSASWFLLVGVMITGIGVYTAFRVLHLLAIRADIDPLTNTTATSHAPAPAPAKNFMPDTAVRVGQMQEPSSTYFHRNPPMHLITPRQMELEPENKAPEYLIVNFLIGFSPLLFLVFSRSLFPHRRVPTFDVLDLDPPGLTALFQDFGGRIQSIGNPRKIKRLSNKLRFQYHYLSLKGFTDDKDFDNLATILIQLEITPPSPTDDFKTFYNANSVYIRSESLARHIYSLNRDAFC